MRQTVLVVLLAAALGMAQSFFNMRGLGELVSSIDARTSGLGSPEAFTAVNPGILVALNRTSFSASGLVGTAVGMQSGASRLVSTVGPASIGAAVPLPWKMRILLGMDSRFSQDFDVWSESTSDTSYRRHVSGRGGIHALRAGLAKSLFDQFCIGVSYGRLVGGTRENWTFEVAPGGASTTDTVEIDYAGNTLLAGISYQHRLFSLAALYEPALNLTAMRYKRISGTTGDSARTYDIGLPAVTRLAGGINPTPQLGLNIGLELRPWSGAKVNGVPAGFRDAWRLSGGAEYTLTSGIPLRIGYSKQDWYYAAVAYPDPGYGSVPIVEHGIHAGTGIPIPEFGSLDLSGSVFLRKAGGLTETAGRLMLTLAYQESWTRRTRRWGY